MKKFEKENRLLEDKVKELNKDINTLHVRIKNMEDVAE